MWVWFFFFFVDAYIVAARAHAVAYKRVWGRVNIPRGGVSVLEREVTLSGYKAARGVVVERGVF